MNNFLVMAVFALLVVAISLLRLLGEKEFFRLTAMKNIWGRTRGLALFFLIHVALPLVVGIVFISRGVVNFKHDQPGLLAFNRTQNQAVKVILDAQRSGLQTQGVARVEILPFKDEFGRHALPIP